MDDFTDYRDGTKPNKVVEGDAVKAAYKTATETLAASQHHRPEFKPADEKFTPEAIDAAFAKLGEAEKAHFEKISATLAKQEDLYQRAHEFEDRAQNLEKWCKESEEMLNNEEEAQTVEAAQIAQDILASFDKDYAEMATKDVEPLKTLAEGLVAEDYCEKDAIDARSKEVVGAYEALKPLRDARDEKNKAQAEREPTRRSCASSGPRRPSSTTAGSLTTVARLASTSLAATSSRSVRASRSSRKPWPHSARRATTRRLSSTSSLPR